MRGKTWLAGGLGALALFAGGCEDDDDQGTHTVTLMEDRFEPEELTIAAGDIVRWTNTEDEEHTVTSGDPETDEAGEVFDHELEEEGADFAYTFTQPGTFEYFCEYHFDMGMTGTVHVE